MRLTSVQYQRRKGKNLEYSSNSGKHISSSSIFFPSCFPCSVSHIHSSPFFAGTLGLVLVPGAPRVNLGWSWMKEACSDEEIPSAPTLISHCSRLPDPNFSGRKNWNSSLLRFWGSPCVLSGTWYGGPSVSWKRERKHLWYKAYTGTYFKVLSVNPDHLFSRVFIFFVNL